VITVRNRVPKQILSATELRVSLGAESKSHEVPFRSRRPDDGAGQMFGRPLSIRLWGRIWSVRRLTRQQARPRAGLG
jgi:hypothetical protein